MKLVILIGVLAGVAALATLVVVGLYLHKKGSTGDVKLIGEIAQVDTQLDPVGTVIVCGELWRAKTTTAAVISAHTRVRVVGFEGHLALVEVCV